MCGLSWCSNEIGLQMTTVMRAQPCEYEKTLALWEKKRFLIMCKALGSILSTKKNQTLNHMPQNRWIIFVNFVNRTGNKMHSACDNYKHGKQGKEGDSRAEMRQSCYLK